MPPNTDPRQLSNTDLAGLCARETHLFFRHQEYDPSFCLELFRRAFKERDDVAWEALCNQYKSLVQGWVQGHPGFASTNEDVAYFVNGAFGKISVSITPERFDSFASLAALLNYLRACTGTIIIDYNRMTERLELEDIEKADRLGLSGPSLEELVAREDRNRQLLEWVYNRAPDRKERLVIEGLFVLGLKPRELYERRKDVFADAAEIYRTKQNVLARLSRDPEFRKLFGDD